MNLTKIFMDLSFRYNYDLVNIFFFLGGGGL